MKKVMLCHIKNLVNSEMLWYNDFVCEKRIKKRRDEEVMAVGFRKSLMGFNREDVMEYIESAQNKKAESDAQYEGKIETLNNQIVSLEKDIESISAERDEISAKLREFDEKYEEIDRLAQNIGKLYLVAQSNAQAIMKNSSESSALAAEEIEKHINAITETQASLDEIKREMSEINAAFSERLEYLLNSLGDTKGRISENCADSEQRAEYFDSVVKMLE